MMERDMNRVRKLEFLRLTGKNGQKQNPGFQWQQAQTTNEADWRQSA